MSRTYVRGLGSPASSLASNRRIASHLASHFSWTDRGSHAVCWWPAAATSALSTAVIVSSRLLSTGCTPALAQSLEAKSPSVHEGQPRQRFRKSARLTKEQHGATHAHRISHPVDAPPSKPGRAPLAQTAKPYRWPAGPSSPHSQRLGQHC